MNRINPKVAMIAAGIFALLLLLYVFAGGESGSRNPDRIDGGRATEGGDSERDNACSSPQTNELIKAELFRQAADLRGRDAAEMARIAPSSLLRIESAEAEETSDGTTCTAGMILDLPPGVAVAGGRHSLPGEASYTVQAGGADAGNGLTLTGAEEIVTPLATLSPSDGRDSETVETEPGLAAEGSAAPAPARTPATTERRAPPERAAASPPPPRPRAAPAPAPAPARASASPSFNCRNARTRGEVAVCNNGSLANLDRQMASQFYRARSAANPRQRALLERTRGSFLRFRDSCGSEACMAGAYRDRMREIADIMADRWNP